MEDLDFGIDVRGADLLLGDWFPGDHARPEDPVWTRIHFGERGPPRAEEIAETITRVRGPDRR